ncbi:hypothetical protein LSPH24S_02868 [Lysinibacillus sphaericus]
MAYKPINKSAAEAVLDGDIKGWQRILPFLGRHLLQRLPI